MIVLATDADADYLELALTCELFSPLLLRTDSAQRQCPGRVASARICDRIVAATALNCYAPTPSLSYSSSHFDVARFADPGL
jgi:hypothetical protein